MKDDSIYRKDAIKLIENTPYDWSDLTQRTKMIHSFESLPSAESKHGKWIVKDGVFYCSCCGNDLAGLSEDDVYVYEIPLPNYCSNCGTDMRDEK